MGVNLILIATFIFWLFHLQQRFCYYLYFWQLKMYRIDRFLEEIQRNKRIILPRIDIFLAIFLLLLYLPINRLLIFYPLVIFYLILGSFSIVLLLRKKWAFPIFTKKVIVIFFLGFLIILFLSFYFRKEILFFILFSELLLPIFTFLCVEVIEIPTSFLRKKIMEKARKKRDNFKNLLVIGITGSYGKSSTKEFLYTLLSQKYGKDKVLKTASNTNTEIGIAQTILEKLKKEHKIFICEMGGYRKGEIKTACNICKPKIGILTGINEQHIAIFGSQENIIEGKYELIESLPEDGLAIFNGNNEICFQLYQKTKIPKKICYTLNSTIVENRVYDLEAKNIKVGKEFISFTVFSKDGDWADFKVNLLGKQNLENILLASCCAKELGMSLKEISLACQKIKQEQSGIKLIKREDGLNVLDASYSANPNGVISHLEYLKIWPRKKVIVMPCLIELGSASKEVHKKIGKKIADVCDLAIITTKDKFEEIKEEAQEKAIFLQDPKEIFEKIKGFCSKGDIVLLESRVPQGLIQRLTKQ